MQGNQFGGLPIQELCWRLITVRQMYDFEEQKLEFPKADSHAYKVIKMNNNLGSLGSLGIKVRNAKHFFAKHFNNVQIVALEKILRSVQNKFKNNQNNLNKI